VREKEYARLEKQLTRLEQDTERRRAKLSNEQFVGKAPAQVVEKERTVLAQTEEELQLIRRKVASLRT